MVTDTTDGRFAGQIDIRSRVKHPTPIVRLIDYQGLLAPSEIGDTADQRNSGKSNLMAF
jgi:hypothetical protein